MGGSLLRFPAGTHVLYQDAVGAARANVDVQPLDIHTDRQFMGRLLRNAVEACHLTLQEAAALCRVDASEFGKWLTGERRFHLDRVFAVPSLSRAFALEFAAAQQGLEVVTQVRSYQARIGGM